MEHETGRKIFHRLYHLLSPRERLQTLGFVVLMLLGAGFEVAGLSIILPFIHLINNPNVIQTDQRLRGIYEALGFINTNSFLIAIGSSLLVIYIVKNGFFAVFYHLQNQFYRKKKVENSCELMTMYMHIPYSFHIQKNSSELIRNMQSAARVVDAVLNPMIVIITESVLLVVVAIFLFWIQPLTTLVAGLVLGISSLAIFRLARSRLNRYSLIQFEHGAEEHKQLLQAFLGLKEVRVLGREEHFISTYMYHFEQNSIASERTGTINQLPRLFMETLLVTGVILFVIAALLFKADVTTLVPTLALFALAAFRLMPSVNRVISSAMAIRIGWNFVNFADDSMRDLRSSGWKPESIRKTEPKPIPFLHQIDLKHISYTYERAASPSVDNVSLSVAKGQSIAFVGRSGAGKTTIVDVILGLLTPQKGSVTVDGRDVTAEPALLQRKIGYIPQQIFLSDESIRRNVAYGMSDPEINDDHVWNALRMAQLEDFVRALPQGLDTPVGERGVRFSGGQRQRLGIARCLYYDREILILDEATSALDNETERAVIESIEALKGKKTIIIIAHRLSTVARCDCLYFMAGGRILDSGTLTELSAKNAEFARFAGV